MEPERTIDELFEEPPETWRMRGDPHLWNAMRNRLGAELVPGSAEELRRHLEQAFLAITGQELSTPDPFHVPTLAHGGMTSGYVATPYWREVVIPKLLACQAEPGFTLKRARWYACESIGAEFGQAVRAYAAIRVLHCDALKSGRGLLDLRAQRLPAAGQGMNPVCRIQVLERGRHYLLARSVDCTPAQYQLFQAIDQDWIRTHLAVGCAADADPQFWLTQQAR